jgi:hypothetical protein
VGADFLEDVDFQNGDIRSSQDLVVINVYKLLNREKVISFYNPFLYTVKMASEATFSTLKLIFHIAFYFLFI